MGMNLSKPLFLCTVLASVLSAASCKSGDVSFLQDREPDVKQDQKETVYNDIFYPESVAELSFGSTAVFFKTEIPKANIYLNNIFQGKSPLEINSLIPGYYVLTVETADTKVTGGQQNVLKQKFLILVNDGEYQNYYIKQEF